MRFPVRAVVAAAVFLAACSGGRDASPTDSSLARGNGGGGKAGSVVIAPATANVPAAQSILLTVSVKDKHGKIISGLPVTWSSTNGGSFSTTGGTTDLGGQATTTFTVVSTAGTVHVITVVADGGSGTASLTVVAGAAAAISIDAGNGGTAAVGTTRTISAKVVDSFGNGVPAYSVAWAAGASSGSVASASTATNASGVASVVWTFGTTPGTQTATATAAGLSGSPLTWSVSVTAGAPASIVKTAGDGQSATVGTAVATDPAVQVSDAYGNLLSGVTVTFTPSAGGSVTGGTPATDGSGNAAVGSWTLATTAGPNSLVATAGSASATFTATGQPGAAAAISIVSGDGGTATVGSTRTLTVKVADAYGNGVGGFPVDWEVASGGGSYSGEEASTDAAGLASADWVLGTTAGPQSATAAGTGLSGSPRTFNVTAVAAAAARYVVTASTYKPAAGANVTIFAQRADTYGNPVAGSGHTVSWSFTGAGGSLSAATSATSASGIATVTLTAAPATGVTHTVTATEGALTGTSPPITTDGGQIIIIHP